MTHKQALQDTLTFLLDPELARAGFERRRNSLCWESPRDGGRAAFALKLTEDAGGWRVTPAFGVRFDAVEELFHRAWGGDAAVRSSSMTLEAEAWRLAGNFDRDQFKVATQEDALKAAAESLGVFDRSAQLFYRRYATLAAIDAALNTRPEDATPFFQSEPVRAGRGLAVASLIRPEAAPALAAAYRRHVARIDAGPGMRSLLRLVELLESQTIAAG